MERDLSWFLEDENDEKFASLTPEQFEHLAANPSHKIEVEDVEPVVVETAAVEPAAPTPTPTPTPAPVDNSAQLQAELAEAQRKVAEQADLLESLKQARVEDKGTGDTKAQDEILDKFKEDYPEVAGAVAQLIEAKQSEHAKQLAELKATMEAQVAPLHEAAQKAAAQAHFDTIKAAVPDFQEIISSGELEAWKNAQPTYVRKAIEVVIAQGTAAEAIELFGQYKASKGIPQTKEALANAVTSSKPKGGVAKTLSDVPSSSVPQVDRDPETANEWLNAFEGKTQAQILEMI
jgi:hypothetical protein